MNLPQFILGVLALAFTTVAVMGAFFIDAVIDPNEVVAKTPSALSELRAVYAGGFAGLTFCCVTAIRQPRYQPFVFALFAIMFGCFALARAGSIWADGTPNTHASVMHLIEGIGFVITFLMWRRLRVLSPVDA